MRVRELKVAVACVVVALLAACAEERLPPRTTVELMDDPVALQAVLARCNASGNLQDVECRHAREAVERLEGEQSVEAVKQKQAAAESEFERAREARRQREEVERRREEAQQKVDPYTMPLIKDPMNPPAQPSTALNPAETPPAS